ncbi:MAG: F0F1 ATP synthase subunit delta [uncultured bacterium]|nr:MAG: F0F1 ATP synthase subunit delta [uncultured bacterium]
MIANSTTVQPYTKAIFALALRDQKFAEWQTTLNLLALIAAECKKRALLNNPRVGCKRELEFFYDAAKNFPIAYNLVRVLAKHKKLEILPNIASGYQKLLLEHQKILEAQITTTRELTPAQKEKLTKALQKRYQQQISLQCQIDDKLIGGVRINIDGQVIDGSIRGMLYRLKQSLL